MKPTIQHWTSNYLPKECYITYAMASLKEQVFSEIELRVFQLLLVNAPDTPLRRSLSESLASSGHVALSMSKVNPSTYTDVDLLRWDLQLSSLLKKSLFAPSTGCPENRAKVESAYCEMKNRASNVRIQKNVTTLKNLNILSRASDIIKAALGPLDTNEWFSACRYGPGTSSSCRKESIHLYGKMSSRLDVTDEAYELFHELVIARPELFAKMLCSTTFFLTTEDFPGGIVRYVDKTALVKRQITVEPHCNMVLQLGLGALIARRLSAVGLGKDHQAERNKFAAHQASLDDKLATWDLRSGSSLICKRLVERLLPQEWFFALDCARSHYSIETTPHSCSMPLLLEKFSEMGNGFTFELETLIFWSILKASCEYDGISGKDCMVFGDDLIFPSQAAPTIQSIFDYCGFEVNQSKSFTTGPFKESCGGDFFSGNNVRPFFLRKTVYDNANLISVANSIRRAAARVSSNEADSASFCDRRFYDAWLFIVSLLVDHNVDVPVGNYASGDTVLWIDESEYCPDLFSKSITIHRDEPRINKGLFVNEAYMASITLGEVKYVLVEGNCKSFYETIYGSLPLVRRPTEAMGSIYKSTIFSDRLQAPLWL